MIINCPQKKIMTSKSAFEISSDQKVHLVAGLVFIVFIVFIYGTKKGIPEYSGSQLKIMTSKSAFEISSDQKVHLVSAANKIGKFCWPAQHHPVSLGVIELVPS